MRIEVKGRNVPVNDALREHIEKRFQKIEKQVSELAHLEVELFEEKDPENRYAAEVALRLKGVTLRARDTGRDPTQAFNAVCDDLSRQVKRHRDKRRGRRESRAAAAAPPTMPGIATPLVEGGPQPPL